MEQTTPRSFFEKYQTFFALILVGVFIGGGIVVAKLIPQKSSESSQSTQTQESVRADLIKLAKKNGVNKTDFAACLDNKDKESQINGAIDLATKSGVTGTPTFFILQGKKQFMILGSRDKDTFIKSIADGKAPADQPSMAAGEKIVLSDADHYRGPKDAQTIIVEYSDIDCPFCKRAAPVIEQILAEHPEFGFVYRHSPIVSLHPFAPYKAQATECAFGLAGADTFWSFLNEIAK